jgi:hypothetical protein
VFAASHAWMWRPTGAQRSLHRSAGSSTSHHSAPRSTVSPCLLTAPTVRLSVSGCDHSTSANIAWCTLRQAIPQKPPSSAGPSVTSADEASSVSTCAGGSAGASLPTTTTTGRPAERAASKVRIKRDPRSPAACVECGIRRSGQGLEGASVHNSRSCLLRRSTMSRTHAECKSAAEA